MVATALLPQLSLEAVMSTNILLAIDAGPGRSFRQASALAEMARELVHDGADQVFVLHVREFSVSRLGRMMTDSGGAEGQHAVDEIVSRLRNSGVRACGQIREADVGHVTKTILDAARGFDARVIVAGAGRRVPLGGVAGHLLRLSTLPVLFVPNSDSPLAAAAATSGRAQPAGLRSQASRPSALGGARPAAVR
jgi:nucleotide-binding universal stress UspA family protein